MLDSDVSPGVVAAGQLWQQYGGETRTVRKVERGQGGLADKTLALFREGDDGAAWCGDSAVMLRGAEGWRCVGLEVRAAGRDYRYVVGDPVELLLGDVVRVVGVADAANLAVRLPSGCLCMVDARKVAAGEPTPLKGVPAARRAAPPVTRVAEQWSEARIGGMTLPSGIGRSYVTADDLRHIGLGPPLRPTPDMLATVTEMVSKALLGDLHAIANHAAGPIYDRFDTQTREGWAAAMTRTRYPSPARLPMAPSRVEARQVWQHASIDYPAMMPGDGGAVTWLPAHPSTMLDPASGWRCVGLVSERGDVVMLGDRFTTGHEDFYYEAVGFWNGGHVRLRDGEGRAVESILVNHITKPGGAWRRIGRTFPERCPGCGASAGEEHHDCPVLTLRREYEAAGAALTASLRGSLFDDAGTYSNLTSGQPLTLESFEATRKAMMDRCAGASAGWTRSNIAAAVASFLDIGASRVTVSEAEGVVVYVDAPPELVDEGELARTVHYVRSRLPLGVSVLVERSRLWALRAFGAGVAAACEAADSPRGLRMAVEEVAREDARLHPAFAKARWAALVAHVEQRGRMGPSGARCTLDALHAYEAARGGARTPRPEAVASFPPWPDILAVYERCRSLS